MTQNCSYPYHLSSETQVLRVLEHSTIFKYEFEHRTTDILRIFVHNARPENMKTEIPEYLPISPLSVRCPLCDAEPNEICQAVSGGRFELVHVARVKAAAKLDEARKKQEEII
jgi:hypothetical protein